ncbi:MAG: OsmC family protein [Polyangiales bacterium]
MTVRDTSEQGARGATMRVSLQRVGPVAFEATDARGAKMVLDGPPELGGEGRGLRPMELLLVSLAGCSAVDVVKILTQQKQQLDDLRIEVEGRRADAVPATYEHIRMRFVAGGDVSEHKLERAVRLSVDKYCSVAKMLVPDVRVEWEAIVADPVL